MRAGREAKATGVSANSHRLPKFRGAAREREGAQGLARDRDEGREEQPQTSPGHGASPTSFAAGAWNSFTTWASSSGLVKRSQSDNGSPSSAPPQLKHHGASVSSSGTDGASPASNGPGDNGSHDGPGGSRFLYLLTLAARSLQSANRAMGKGMREHGQLPWWATAVYEHRQHS